MAATLNKILYISSSFSKIKKTIDIHDYFAAVFSELAIQLQEKYKNVEIVVKVPGNTLNPDNEQINFIAEAINSKVFDCIIVSPINIKSIYSKLGDWSAYLKEYKLLFIDQGFVSEDINSYDFTSYPKPPFVQAKWEQGGAIAADSIVTKLIAQNILCPHIVLMEGNIGSAERIKGFKETISTKYAGKIFPTYYSIFGDYKYDTSFSEFDKYLNASITSKNPIDAVFSTNDEMALGIRSALQKNDEKYTEEISKNINNRSPIVCGFDGIRDVTILIDNNDKFIFDTIVVNLDKQVLGLVDIISKAIVNKVKPRPNSNDYYIEVECMTYIAQKNAKK